MVTCLYFLNVTVFNYFRLEHMKMHEKHKGHEAMHTEMVLILVITVIVAQVALVEWKRRHQKSYQVLISL